MNIMYHIHLLAGIYIYDVLFYFDFFAFCVYFIELSWFDSLSHWIIVLYVYFFCVVWYYMR